MDDLVETIMRQKPETVDPNTTVSKAATIFAKQQDRCLVVARDGLVVGIVTASDIIEKVTATGANPSEVYLRDIMSTPVVTAKKSDSIGLAARAMSDYRIGRLPVLDETGGLVGIVTYVEISRWAAKQSGFEGEAPEEDKKDESPYR
jgi:CBS domain-containing protein